MQRVEWNNESLALSVCKWSRAWRLRSGREAVCLGGGVLGRQGGTRGGGRRGPARSGPAGVWGCEARRGGGSRVARLRSDRGEQARCRRRPSLGRLGRPCPFLAAHMQASPLRPGCLRKAGLASRGWGSHTSSPGPDLVSPSPAGPGPPVTHAESSEGFGSAVVRRLSHPGGR